MKEILELDAHCRRVLGALLEKEQTTPDYYPLTLNALISACNQSTNREPVMTLKQYEVLSALHSLERVSMVQRVTGPRADRWSHLLIQATVARSANKAVLTVLLLRGAQTVGEIKGRTERMYAFPSLDAVESLLAELTATDPPLVREIPRRPGQKESRWTLNILGEEPEWDAETLPEVKQSLSAPAHAPLDDVSRLEARIRLLEEQVAAIMDRLDQEG